MSTRPHRLYLQYFLDKAGRWAWDITHADGEVVMRSVRAYTRRLDAQVGFTRVWGRTVIDTGIRPARLAKPAVAAGRKVKARRSKR